MKHVVIICEGPTEFEFCKELLLNYFLERGIFIQPVLPKKSGGGIVAWQTLSDQIKNHLGSTSYVSTLIDFYGIKTSQNYPYHSEAILINDKNIGVKKIEDGMYNDIGNQRFIPYIQLHEFEALLFCDISPFNKYFSSKEADMPAIEKVINSLPNPELINDNPVTAPSKRLLRHIQGYDKVLYGSILACDIGLDNLRAKCPRFNEWIQKLENLR